MFREINWRGVQVILSIMVFCLSSARAEIFPERPITVVVAQAAGGGSDAVTRLWAEYASKALRQPVIVDNKPGGGGIIAAQYVLSKPADGYTIFSAGLSSVVLSKFAYKTIPFDAAGDFCGVAMLVKIPYILSVSKDSGIKSIADLKRIARDGKLNFGSAGTGNSTHVVGEILQAQLGIKLAHIPYKGEAQALSALIANEVQVTISVLSTALPLATAGRITPIMILGSSRVGRLPAVPTAESQGLTGLSVVV